MNPGEDPRGGKSAEKTVYSFSGSEDSIAA